MKYYVFRNTTVEPFFKADEVAFSGYEDISSIDLNAETFVWFYILPPQANSNIAIDQISFYFSNLKMVFQQIPKNKLFCIFTLSDLYSTNIQTGDFSLLKAINEFNLNIIQLANENQNIKVIDSLSFYNRYSGEQLIDWKYYYISQMLLNPKLAKNFKAWFQTQMDAIHMRRKKCIVLDLDNTLWGGVLGEEGISGIKIGGDYPGSAFLEFQKSLIELSKLGIILTVCSKNNESDVIEAWEKNPNLLIRKEHIAAYKINWNNKAENIKLLSEELNIGLDSMVFIDDNPAERELVKQIWPMVETPEFPTQPYLLPPFVKDLICNYFQIYNVTNEDKAKTEQYKSNAERLDFQKQFTKYSEYLESLDIQIELQKANKYNISRIAQMTQKTNQFNLTTQRYTESDILDFVEKNNAVYCINIKDKFGDNGITGIMIIELDYPTLSAKINSLLLSCRVLGKNIEDAFVFFVMKQLKSDSFKTLYATYIPTSNNEQVKMYYEKLGFTFLAGNNSENDTKNYFIDLTLSDFKIEPYYKIEIQ